ALGAAAAAGRTIGLSPDGMVEACALAGGSAATGVSPEPARSFSLGMAVAQGIAAAVAAAEGLRGDRRMLERWSSAHGRADFPAVLPAPPGPAVTRSMCKPFAGARQVLAGSTTLRSLVERGEIDPLAVVGIELGVAPLHAAMVDRPSIQHRLDTLASAQYQLATALDRPAHLDVLDQPRPPDAALERRMRTVRVVADETLARAFPDRWGARLEIELRHGRARQVVGGVAGESAFGWEELAGKVRRLAGANLAGDGDTAADPLLQLLHAARDDRWADLLAALLRVMLRQQEEGERCDD
ncbi:MAG: hypothetical protein ACRDYZ_13915, partial [Acidimicrobiales bacterium]